MGEMFRVASQIVIGIAQRKFKVNGESIALI
jgi:hypothetical protein